MSEEDKDTQSELQSTPLVPRWYWKEIRSHLVSDEVHLRKKFEPHLNTLIESAFSSGQTELIRRDFKIDLQRLLMITTGSEDEENNSFPLLRSLEKAEPQASETVNEEYKEEMLKYSPLILGEWYKRNIPKMYHLTYIRKLKYAFEAARLGILAKGKQLGADKEKQAKKLVKTLMENIKENDPEILLTVIAKVYTMDSFLFIEANKFLRNNYQGDIDILGPFCFLLNEYLWLTELKSIESYGLTKNKIPKNERVLYRCVRLFPEDLFKTFPLNEKVFKLSAFSSCSISREIQFRSLTPPDQIKLLLEIEIPSDYGLFCRNIANLSAFPDEKEVLLAPGSILVVKERFTDEEGVYIIRGKLLPNMQVGYNIQILKEHLRKSQQQTSNLKIFNEYLTESKKSSWWWRSLAKIFKFKTEEEVTWYWKANKDPWSGNEPDIWKEYTPDQINTIEQAYRSGQLEVQLENFHLDFKKMLQLNSKNSQLIPVKRNDPRGERMHELLLYESIGKYLSPFIVGWQAEFLVKYGAPILKHVQTLTELISLGIVAEGKAQNHDSVGKDMANRLQKHAKTSKYDIEEVFKYLARLYTEETFLYKTVNKALRENDLTKADTLGAFCLLFNELITYFDTLKKYPYSGTVWRGCAIKGSILKTYYPDKKPFLYWPAFSSTSKDRSLAEIFMVNVLFEIRLYDKGVDVEQFSALLGEREVLIHSGSVFKILEHKMIGKRVHHIILSSQAF